jgi:hypothetical protein
MRVKLIVVDPGELWPTCMAEAVDSTDRYKHHLNIYKW